MKIVAVNFTYACPGGMWIRRENGQVTWVHALGLIKEVGDAEYQRLCHIAQAGGMTGMWYNASNGRNVYVDGKEVNADVGTPEQAAAEFRAAGLGYHAGRMRS